MNDTLQNIAKISVYLPDEEVDTWLPVQAEILGSGLYKLLLIDDYDPELMRWEFPPGSTVRGAQRDLWVDGIVQTVMVAIAPSDQRK